MHYKVECMPVHQFYTYNNQKWKALHIIKSIISLDYSIFLKFNNILTLSLCHMQGETKRAQLVSIVGIIVGTMITAGVITVLVILYT